jgi:hypothetical protein
VYRKQPVLLTDLCIFMWYLHNMSISENAKCGKCEDEEPSYYDVYSVNTVCCLGVRSFLLSAAGARGK